MTFKKYKVGTIPDTLIKKSFVSEIIQYFGSNSFRFWSIRSIEKYLLNWIEMFSYRLNKLFKIQILLRSEQLVLTCVEIGPFHKQIRFFFLFHASFQCSGVREERQGEWYTGKYITWKT